MTDSPTSKRTSAWPAVTAVALLVLLTAYVGAYLWLGELEGGLIVDPRVRRIVPIHHRNFPHATLSTIYYPMGWIESRVRGEWVSLGGPMNAPFRPHEEHYFEPSP